jgi:hypothetical protein
VPAAAPVHLRRHHSLERRWRTKAAATASGVGRVAGAAAGRSATSEHDPRIGRAARDRSSKPEGRRAATSERHAALMAAAADEEEARSAHTTGALTEALPSAAARGCTARVGQRRSRAAGRGAYSRPSWAGRAPTGRSGARAMADPVQRLAAPAPGARRSGALRPSSSTPLPAAQPTNWDRPAARRSTAASSGPA